jgi:hypothetical protein
MSFVTGAFSKAVGGLGSASEVAIRLAAYDQASPVIANVETRINSLKSRQAELLVAQEKARQGHKASSKITTELAQIEKDLGAEYRRSGALLKSRAADLKALNTSYEKLTSTVGALYSVSKQATKYFAAPILALDALYIKNAAWAIEMENLFKVTTGRMTEEGWAWTVNLEKQVGISQTRARQMVGIMHVMITAIGVAEEKAMKMATNLTKLGYDISSFYNVPVEVAFEKLQSGIVGLPRGLKTLGIVVTEAMVKQWALTNAIIKQGETMTEQQEVFARYNVIMEQTSKAQGDMARTMESPQNQIRILGEKLYELSVNMGKTIIPAFQSVMKVIIAVVGWLNEMPKGLKKVVIVGSTLAALFVVASAGVLRTTMLWLKWNGGITNAAKNLGILGKVMQAVFSKSGLAWVVVITTAIWAVSKLFEALGDHTKEYQAQLDIVKEKLVDEFGTIQDRIKLKQEEIVLENKLKALAEAKEAAKSKPPWWLGRLEMAVIKLAKRLPLSGLGIQMPPDDLGNIDWNNLEKMDWKAWREDKGTGKATREYLKSAAEAGIAAQTLGEAQRKLGEGYMKWLKEGGDSVTKYKQQIDAIAASIDEVNRATNLKPKEREKEIDKLLAEEQRIREKMKPLDMGRAVALAAAKEKGFLFETYNINKNLLEMLQESPAAVRAITLTIQGLDPAMAAFVDRQREAADELMKIEGIAATMIKSSQFPTQTEMRERLAAIELVRQAAVARGITNELDIAKQFGPIYEDLMKDFEVVSKYNKASLKDKEKMLALEKEIAALEAGITGTPAPGGLANIGKPQGIGPYTQKAANERIKAAQEELRALLAKFSPDTPEQVAKIAALSAAIKKDAKEVPTAMKKAAKEVGDLVTKLDNVKERLESIRIDSAAFTANLKSDLAEAMKDMTTKTETGVQRDFEKMAKDALRPTTHENPLAAELRENEERWKAMETAINEELAAYEKLKDDKLKYINEYYRVEQEKLIEFIGINKLKVQIVAETEKTISALRVAAETGSLDEATKNSLIERSNKALLQFQNQGLDMLADNYDKNLGELAKFVAEAKPTIDKLYSDLLSIPDLKSEDEKKIMDTFIFVNGLFIKLGQGRRKDIFDFGLSALSGKFAYAAKVAGDFFSTVESGFATNLVSAIGLVGNALEELSQYFDELSNQVGPPEARNFLKGLKNGIEAIKDETLAAIGAALGGMISGTKSNLGGVGGLLGTILKDQTGKKGIGGSIMGLIGNIPGVGGILASALPAITGLIGGLFGKKSKEEKEADRVKDLIPKITKNMAYLGKISEETAKKIAEAMKTLSEHAATSKYFADVITDVGVNQKNVNALWSRASEIFTDMKNKTLTVGEATTALNDSFTAMLEGAKKLGTEGSNAMVKFIKLAQASGAEISAVIDYVNEQLGVTQEGILGAAKGLEMMIGGTAKELEDLMAEKTKVEEELTDRLLRGYARRLKEKELRGITEKIRAAVTGFEFDIERVGRLALATFNEMVKNGVSVRDAFASISPTLDMLVERYKAMGTEASGGVKELLRIREITKANEELFNAIEGNKIVMESLYNVGGLTEALFQDSQAQMKSYYDQLIAKGMTEQEALAMLVPTMETINKVAKERGWIIDDQTQKYIDQAAAFGLAGNEQLSFVDAILAGFGELIFALTGKVPNALKDSVGKLEGYYERMEEKRRRQEGRGRQAVNDFSEATNDAGASTRNAADIIVGGWNEITNAIGKATEAQRQFANTTPRRTGATSVSLDKDEISGQGGGAWRVTGREQVFRAHQGETVTIYKPDTNRSVPTVAPSAAPGGVTNTFKFDINTLDADSFERMVQKKLIPLLERYTKSEALLIHPNAVRRF